MGTSVITSYSIHYTKLYDLSHCVGVFLPFKGINCDEFQFFLAFFMLLGNNPPPLYVPSGLMRSKTYPYLNGLRQSLDWLEMVELMGPWLIIILVGTPCLIL